VVEVSGEAPAGIEQAGVAVEAGEGLTLALSGAPLPASDRRVLDAFAAQSAAVLERNRLAARAADAARLAQTDAVRTALLTAVSHDLRTPLAGIKASVATLRDPQLEIGEQDQRTLLDSAAEEADRLDALLTNLLDLSRLQTGAVSPVMTPTSPTRCSTACAPCRASTSSMRPATPCPWCAPSPDCSSASWPTCRERRALAPPAAGAATVAAVPGGSSCVVDRVRGAGRGQPRIFTAFQRLGDAPAGNGVGLGLAVARGLADAVGATLDAEDTPGGGLTMVVGLPLAAREGASA
jgi:two-component system sensor histidine kinase KdpD